MRAYQVLIASTALLSVACGDDKPQLSHENAKQAYQAFNQAIATAGPMDVSQVSQVACKDGGHVKILQAPRPGEQIVIKTAYQGCKSGGVTIDGEFQVATDLRQGDFLALDTFVNERHTGKLRFSGVFESECDVDMRVEHVITEIKNPARSGDFCGHDVASLQ